MELTDIVVGDGEVVQTNQVLETQWIDIVYLVVEQL